MKKEKEKFLNQGGVSYVELLVVITMLVIISTIALMQFGKSREQLKRQNVATELKNAFERSRFDSVKRRADLAAERAYVIINQNSFTLVTDVNQNGTVTDAVDSRITDFSAQGIRINSTLTLPYTVYFNKRGEAVNSGGASISPVFNVCNGTCPSPLTDASASIVLVTPTGTVNLLPGASSTPSFNAPNPITNVPGNSQIRNSTIMNSP